MEELLGTIILIFFKSALWAIGVGIASAGIAQKWNPYAAEKLKLRTPGCMIFIVAGPITFIIAVCYYPFFTKVPAIG